MATNALMINTDGYYTGRDYRAAPNGLNWGAAETVDPRLSEFFRPQDRGEGQQTMGNGNGSGYYNFSGLPGFEKYVRPEVGFSEAYDAGMWGINPDELSADLASKGYTLRDIDENTLTGGTGLKYPGWFRWIEDKDGNVVGDRQFTANTGVSDQQDFLKVMAAAAAGGYFSGGESAAVGGSTGGAGTITGGSGISSAGGAGGALGTGGGLSGTGLGTSTVAGGSGLTAGTGLGGTGAGLSVGGTAAGTATGLSSTGLGTAAAGGGMSTAGTSLADFFSGNGNWNDYLRAGQAAYGMYAQDKATDAATAGNQAQMALMREMWQANQAENKPLVDMRNSVLPQISNLLQNPGSITQDPGYQFQLKQGQNQLDNRAAASGNYYSGAQQRAAQRYGQDYAGTKLDQSLNRLMGVATGTQVGSNQNQANNTGFAQAGGNALAQGGNIRAGGYLGQFNTVNNAGNNWLQDYYNQQAWGKP